ncbi:hypothetical protein LCGC14_1474530 [marine sediment metagenome]|uniref:Putative regulatory protein FmdB zinc ribbon domain-containing protein n=1 Tax=marine sediment metagenome TaxID=412755 RepID=A0A0F9JBC0_9ZZZZ
MPTYEYKCKKCDKKFEEFQSVNDDAIEKCIHCDGEVSRVFHPVGVIFKGSGFYSTDNKKKESKPSEKKPEPKKKTDKASCAKKDSCPAAESCN